MRDSDLPESRLGEKFQNSQDLVNPWARKRNGIIGYWLLSFISLSHSLSHFVPLNCPHSLAASYHPPVIQFASASSFISPFLYAFQSACSPRLSFLRDISLAICIFFCHERVNLSIIGSLQHKRIVVAVAIRKIDIPLGGWETDCPDCDGNIELE